ncbi:MAG: N-acetyltransferase [Nanoarchaeota archaeon]|nr:N-acetyltransferase [Nanoarchaeota archaeon]
MIHESADVAPDVVLGVGTKIWHHVHVREGVHIGENCILSKGVYIDRGVRIGKNVKIQNYASVFHGAIVDDGVFIGPYACISNDRFPRAVNPDGSLKIDADWTVRTVHIEKGASIGAGAIILPGKVIGTWALVGAGAIVTKDVPAHGMVHGNPARLVGLVCSCGRPFPNLEQQTIICGNCKRKTTVPDDTFKLLKR